jgi:hypothetical protein
MVKTETSAAWAAEHQQRARADRAHAMVEARDKRIAKLQAEVAERDAVIARRDSSLAQCLRDNAGFADGMSDDLATIKQLRADVTERDKRIAELAASRDNEINLLCNSIACNVETIGTLQAEVADRDKRIVAQRDELDARGERIADLIIAFNGEVSAGADRDATIEQLESDVTDARSSRDTWLTTCDALNRIASGARVSQLRLNALKDVNAKLRARVHELEGEETPTHA